jgi:hypothetical protein
MGNPCAKDRDQAQWEVTGIDYCEINGCRNRATNTNHREARPKANRGVKAEREYNTSIENHAGERQDQKLLNQRRSDRLLIRVWGAYAALFKHHVTQ